MANTVGIYLRLSTDDGRAGESSSIDGQRAECRPYAERHGWRVVEYVDDRLFRVSGAPSALPPGLSSAD